MLTTTLFALLSAGASIAAPIMNKRVTLDPAATAEAQPRDDTATRAFSNATITTSDGKCLSVTSGTGDFRNNLLPVNVVTCDGSAGQQFDVITAGKHNNVPGTALIVSSLIEGCLNFDPRRAAGNQVLLFSCGGRADGGGLVANSQQFTFSGSSTTIPLAPINQAGTCLFNNNGKLDQQSCTVSSPSAGQLFTIGGGAPAASAPPAIVDGSTAASAPPAIVGGSTAASAPPAIVGGSTATTATNATATTESAIPPATTAAAAPPAGETLTQLNAAAVAEAQPRDDTATRAFSSAAIKTSDGKCLSVTSGTGDFRNNLVPVNVVPCDGSAGQQFDVITAGKHNNVPGTALIVSSLIEGCLNFDPRRAAGNQVILFSCGGRGDGGGLVANSQQFTFSGNSTTIPLAPINQAGTCLFNNNGKLDQQSCTVASPSVSQLFTISP